MTPLGCPGRLPLRHLVFGHFGSCEQRWFEKLFFFASTHQAQLQLHIVPLLPFYKFRCRAGRITLLVGDCLNIGAMR